MGPARVEDVPRPGHGREGRRQRASAMARPSCGTVSVSTGGWNYGNSNVFGKDLPAYIPTTAIALLALQDCRDEPFVRHSLDFLEEQAGNHPSTRALALTTLALRRHGRSTSAVEGALRTWLANHPSPDVASARDGAVRAGGICSMIHSLSRPDRRAFLAALAAAPLAAAACGRRKYDPARFRRPAVSPVFLSAVTTMPPT